MSRRRTVVLASAATLFALGGLLAGAVAFVTQTGWGREQIRTRVMALINSKVQGTLYIGHLEGSLFTNLVVDSFAIREKNDSLFVATGPIHIRFDPRDLLDRRIVASEVTIERAFVHIHQDSTKQWNYRRIFPSGPKGPPKPVTVRNFGDYIFVNAARAKDVTFLLTMPWHPDDSLSGARADSAARVQMARTDKHIRQVGSQYEVQRRWTNGQLQLGPSRIDDRDALGRQFDVVRLDADEFDPPFKFREARGALRNKGDSLWADISHFRLPGSRGTAKGKVWWGSDLPTRYDLTFTSDSLSLADVAWVYPTLPTTGGGRMTLHIGNGRDLRQLEYALRDMDVRTMNSRLRGNMTFGTGAPVLIVKDIDLRADPIDWVLIEQFTGEPLPYPFKGEITATVQASGGPVNRFVVDRGEFTWRDGNVPGAVNRGTVKGTLDILAPAFTTFRGFDVALAQFDLRTIQFVNPAFPRFFGLISGTATLDSVWTDIRFRNADITHRFEDAEPSRFTGNGRVTIGETLLTYDLAVDAKPLSLTTVARAYPEAELIYRGTYTGPLRLQGQADDLAVVTELVGPPGRLAYDGRVDADSVGGYGYTGTLRFNDLDLRLLLDTATVPHTSLNGTIDLDVLGDSLPNWEGPFDLALDRSLVDSVRVYAGARARMRFGGGRLRIDTMHVETALLSATAQGGIGLMPGMRDSLAFTIAADSLGALRQYLVRASSGDSAASASALRDSLGAEITGRGVLSGSIDSLDVRGALDVRRLTYATYGARVARVSADLKRVALPDISGTVNITADTLSLGGVAVSSAGLDLEVQGRSRVNFGVLATLSNGPVLETRGMFGVSGDTTRVGLDAFRLALEGRAWTLQRPATLWAAGGAFSADTVRLLGSRGGEILLAGTSTADSVVRLRAQLDSVSMADMASLSQSNLPLTGWFSARVDAEGTRLAPTMTLTGAIDGAKVGQVNVARATLQGTYANRRLQFGADLLRNDSTVVTLRGNAPVDLSLVPVDQRLLRDTLRVAMRATELDMSVVESFFPTLTNAKGRLTADISLAGTSDRSALEGFLRLDSAAATIPDLGIRLRNMYADLVASRDTLRIRRFSVVSGNEPRDSLWMGGWVARLIDQGGGAAFDVSLGARDFQAIANRRVADLSLSAGLRLNGTLDRSRLSGNVTVNRGVIVIPPFTGKQLISLDDPELYNVVDTTVFANRALLPRTPPEFVNNLTVDNVRITMGPDVRVRSEEADIKLGGAVNVTVGERRGGSAPQLALDGALQTERGYYRLELGGLVQRTFTVEGGELRFLNETELNPILNISALHTVRQISSNYGGRNDVRIRVRVQGTLIRPSLRLESADSLQLSESDLISYLVAGVPSFGLGGQLSANRFSASSIALSTISSYISAKFSGGLFDYVNIQTTTGGTSTQQQSRQGLLNGVQFGIGKQLGERTFLSLTTGLCRFGASGGQLNPVSLGRSIGAKLEQRLSAGYGFSFSLEPPLDELFCSTGTDRSFTTTRRQYGFDLFRAWRW